ncbi:MAG: hypothetical protein U9N34_08230 [Candidatus Cloacimonadota bacterium]|nr:hypothetical protein [Candidatus Cloacimonadota bacterium]
MISLKKESNKRTNTFIRIYMILFFIMLTIVFSSCSPLLQSAELAPPEEFTHTIRSGFMIINPYPYGFGYHLAYGINNHVEINSELDIFLPRASFGFKTKLLKNMSFGLNATSHLTIEPLFTLTYPEITIIYGNSTYIASRVSIIDFNTKSIFFQLFLGKKFKVFKSSYIIPEISINEGLLHLGLGFEL